MFGRVYSFEGYKESRGQGLRVLASVAMVLKGKRSIGKIYLSFSESLEGKRSIDSFENL